MRPVPGLRGGEPGRSREQGPRGGVGQGRAQHRLPRVVQSQAGVRAWGWQLRLWALSLCGKEKGVGKATVTIH